MTADAAALNPDWERRIKEVGVRAFEIEEMIRLGFLDRAKHKAELETSKKAAAELAEINRELIKINWELERLTDTESLIEEIRARRIERVQAAAAVRRAEKELARQERARAWKLKKQNEPPYLGPGVSGRLNFTGGQPEDLASRNLPVIHNFVDLAEALELTPSQLQWLTYARTASATDHYTRFEIPKRSGGTRLISSPKPALRAAQQWVRTNILVNLPVHPDATAFRPRKSIVDNARRHTSASIVVKTDLKDFFPSITFPRVRGYFESLGYNPGIATVLALICTDAPRAIVTLEGTTSYVAIAERSLPQGACTSPDLANLIARPLDNRMAGLAASRGWTYTRYADDLVFSHPDSDARPHLLLRMVKIITSDEGFRINHKKTRIMRSPNRRSVTGLIVDDGVRLSRKDLRRVRAFLHQCETRGLDAMSEELGKNAAAVAHGHLSYIHMVMPEMARKLRERHTWLAQLASEGER